MTRALPAHTFREQMTIDREHHGVRRTATGLGLFSLLPIPARRRIVEYLGPVVIRQEVEWKGGR